MKPEASRGGGVACPDPPACSLAEPGAGKSHAGICEGRRATGSRPRHQSPIARSKFENVNKLTYINELPAAAS